MNNLFIDDRAIEFIKKALENEKASSIRIFTASGGCCGRFEIATVDKALAGDVTFMQDGVKVHVEKEIADNTVSLWIRFDEKKGLFMEFK